MRSLALVVVAACSSPQTAPLPPLDSMQTLLVGEPGAKTLRAITLPTDELRFDLPIEPTAGAHGNALLYARSIAEMGLPVDDGVLPLLEGPDLDPLPRPDHAFSLGIDLTWHEEDATPWTLRRIEPLRCLAFDSFALDLGVIGDVLTAMAWSPTEVLIALHDDDHLMIVSKGSVRELPDVVPPDATTWTASMDDAGHIWVAYSSYPAATGTVAENIAITFVELDRDLRIASETTANAGPEGLIVDEIAVGRFDGRVEIFVLSAPGSLLPRVHRWREGETSTHRLPWPTASDVISECHSIGVFRSSIVADGPNSVSFIVKQGIVQHYVDGVFMRERVGSDACGGTLADDTVTSSIAILTTDRTDTTLPQFRVLGRADGGWEESGLMLGAVNGLDMVTWLGRAFTTGNQGRIVEIDRTGSGFRICKDSEVAPTISRVRRLVAMGGELFVAGEPREMASTHVYWMKPK